jgi:hypothetical protein
MSAELLVEGNEKTKEAGHLTGLATRETCIRSLSCFSGEN